MCFFSLCSFVSFVGDSCSFLLRPFLSLDGRDNVARVTSNQILRLSILFCVHEHLFQGSNQDESTLSVLFLLLIQKFFSFFILFIVLVLFTSQKLHHHNSKVKQNTSLIYASKSWKIIVIILIICTIPTIT